MQLGYVGINYKNTDLSVRDKITFTDSGIADFMQQAEEAGVNQCMCLSTCNRCEVFYLYEDETFVQVMSDLFNDYFGLTDTKLAGVKCGEEALVYLFCIAAGLESMVLGEDQILGQLKDAADLSRTLGHSGKELNYIVRDHDKHLFEAKKNTLRLIEKNMNEKWGKGTVTLAIKDQYKNMSEIIAGCMNLIDNAKKACELADITPLILPIRGGTDGCQLSFKGLPCPNLGTGGHAYHGPYEHITIEGMDMTVAMLVKLVGTFTE